MGLTILKRLCRKFGLPRWPYRKLSKAARLTCDATGCDSGQGTEQQQHQQQDVAPQPHLLPSGVKSSGLATEDSGMVPVNSDAHALSSGNTSSEPVATLAPKAGGPTASLAGIDAQDGSLPSLPTSARGSLAPASAKQLQQQQPEQRPAELMSTAVVARPRVYCSSPSKLDVLLDAIENEVPKDAAADGREGEGPAPAALKLPVVALLATLAAPLSRQSRLLAPLLTTLSCTWPHPTPPLPAQAAPRPPRSRPSRSPAN